MGETTSAKTPTTTSFMGAYDSTSNVVVISILAVLALQVIYRVCLEAYQIRMYAIEEYGPVIHEFDPYFNYRATEYLYANGWKAFSQWFDYMVWYPLGRPVGTTIFPGMQVTSVFIKNHILPDWSINDICCYIPSWFGVLATLAVAFLSYETTRNDVRYESIFHTVPIVREVYSYVIDPAVQFLLRQVSALTGSTLGFNKERPAPPSLPLWTAACSAAVMAIVPAHLMRSIGGGYDNESIAMTAMVLTFACWTRALADQPSLVVTTLWGAITGVAYFYMVAAWGGFTFVLNLIGVHASVLVLMGRYSTKLHRAYSTFYFVGTFLAIQVPVVGWSPLKSIEQLGPFVAFGGMHLIELCEEIRRRRKKRMTFTEMWKLRIMVFGVAGVVAALVVFLLAPTGYFGPLSSRVRGLFVKHTKTGNPLVDSVAEHQAAKPEAYKQYLSHALYLSPFGLGLTALFYFNDSSSFLLVYAAAAYYFSHRMVRLILLTAPIASCLAGIAMGRFLSWSASGLLSPKVNTAIPKSAPTKSKKKKGKGSKDANGAAGASSNKPLGDALWGRVVRVGLGAFALFLSMDPMMDFYQNSHQLAEALSHPTIIQKAQTRDGKIVKIDDYRQAYFWLRDNTPADARILAWWDYGYQITGIANRTTIADGNTWNHEHIALLGRILTAPEKESHRIARHLADYVLVWAGGGGDDIAKSPHLRRIANSVYRGLCAEPLCSDFGFYSDRTPTPDMSESMLFKLVGAGVHEGVQADKNRFREVYRTKYGKVRIYKILSVSQESKEWAADPANRLCDAPGSWFCPGQYPPALEKVLKEKKDFKQLEDFNAKGADDSDYQKEYFERLLNKKDRRSAPPKAIPDEEKGKKQKLKLNNEDIEIINEKWETNDLTKLMYKMISENKLEDFRYLLSETPTMVHIRSGDGRGPMWWAHEFGRSEMVDMLKKYGVSEKRTDEEGLTPLDVSKLKS